MSLATLMFVVDSEATSGAIRFEPRGRLSVRDGELINARLGTLRGLDAFYELFLDGPTSLSVDDDVVIEGPSLGMTAGLVLEGTRRADEWLRVCEDRWAWRGDVPATDGSATALAAVLDGHRTGRELAEASRLPRHQVGVLLAGWLDAAVLTRGSPPPPPRPGFFECIDLGREAYRAGRIEEAVVAFEDALQQRPGDRIAGQNLRRARARLMSV